MATSSPQTQQRRITPHDTRKPCPSSSRVRCEISSARDFRLTARIGTLIHPPVPRAPRFRRHNRNLHFASAGWPAIHPRAAERTTVCSSPNRPAPEAVTSDRADVKATEALTFGAFLTHRSTLAPLLCQSGCVACAARRLREHLPVHGHQPDEILLSRQQVGLEPTQRRCQRRTPVPELWRPDETKGRVLRKTPSSDRVPSLSEEGDCPNLETASSASAGAAANNARATGVLFQRWEDCRMRKQYRWPYAQLA